MAFGLAASDVKVLFPDSVKSSDETVQTLIDDADVLVQEVLVQGGANLTDQRLGLIEKYLAAHFLCVIEERGQLGSSKTGGSEDTYKGQFTMGFDLTRYGQQALVMDTSGKLMELANPSRRAQFKFYQQSDWLAGIGARFGGV